MTDVERYLFRYNNLERMKKSIENELSEAMSEYNMQSDIMLRPTILSDINAGKTNKVSNPVQDAVVKIVDIFKAKVDRLTNELNSITIEQKMILTTIKKANLTTLEDSYIRWRYFKGYRSWQVAQRMQYCERQALRFRASALLKISVTLKDVT
jgi:hypothetical protein